MKTGCGLWGIFLRIVLVLSVVAASFAIYLIHEAKASKKVLRSPLPLVASNTARLTFELPKLDPVNLNPRVLALVRVVDLQEMYYYVRDGGKTWETTQPDGAYSPSESNSVKQLSVLKPLSGEWSFRVDRTIKRGLFLPFLYLPLKAQHEVWESVVFTNQNRPPDVLPLARFPGNGPFE